MTVVSRVALTFAAVTVAGIAFTLARPQPVSNSMLGAEWRCSRTAFVLTTCSPLTGAVPTLQLSRKLGAPGV